MGLEIKQTIKLSQNLVMTPQLQLSLRLLAMNRQELAQTLQTELLENPTLEEDTAAENVDWTENIEPYSNTNVLRTDTQELPSIDQTFSKEESLKEHLLWQIQMSDMNILERDIADHLLGELDEKGYLDTSSVNEISQTSEVNEVKEEQPKTPKKSAKQNTKERLKSFDTEFPSMIEEDKPALMTYLTIKSIAKELEVPVDWVENVRKRIMHLDPVGCLAGDIRECLLAQLEVLGFGRETIPYRMIDQYLSDLTKRRHQNIMEHLHIQEEEFGEAFKLIEHLEPNPARAYSSSYMNSSQHVSPDIFVTKSGDEFLVTLNDNGLPKLKLNRFYLDEMKKHKKDESSKFIQDKIRSALWLTKAIYQRQSTIVRVMQTIIQFQHKWFADDLPLRPLTLREVASEIGMHESTISRVTSGKYALTPKGLYELKYFFSTAISTDQNEGIAGEAVKEIIKKMIASENSQHPLSDSQLVLELAKQNIFIARRTIAKYRESLNISPSHQRRQW